MKYSYFYLQPKAFDSNCSLRWGYQCDSPVGEITGTLKSHPPSTNPPPFIPSKSQSLNNINISGLTSDGSALKPLMFKFIYIWLRDGSNFWSWTTFIYGGHIGGFRWTGYHWENFEVDLRKIDGYSY